ncbi:MAG: hypothetical protein Ta2G_02090 [Termitinemataceae bacterium]|nr:MAG: hypothetical protein Ta2G_02090 [Termitinemataceae bacterium]
MIYNEPAYKKICVTVKKYRLTKMGSAGLTVADITAKSALPLQKVKELLPVAADEYSAHLQVTESGEIIYIFPKIWRSKYTSLKARFSRFADKLIEGVKVVGMTVFKFWIMIMLIGYFVFFLLLALAALLLSVAAQSKSNSSDNRGNSAGGGFFLVSNLFDMIIRIWFYSELTKSTQTYRYNNYNNYNSQAQKPKGKPLHKAIFSFVFGDGNPNANQEERQKQAVIAYIQANKGVISLPEFMLLTGFEPLQAENKITEYCVQYGGSPEVSCGGTVVYKFDDLLLRPAKKGNAAERSLLGTSAALKNLRTFSGNKSNMNTAFCFINGINLLFGSYFLFFLFNGVSANSGGAFLFIMSAHIFASLGITNLVPVMFFGLGLVPIVFSLLFWLIPAIRLARINKENEEIKFENLRKYSITYIYNNPLDVQSENLKVNMKECTPLNLKQAQDKIINEIGGYYKADVTVTDDGKTSYIIKELENEKTAVENYRATLNTKSSDLGSVVFEA